MGHVPVYCMTDFVRTDAVYIGLRKGPYSKALKMLAITTID